MTSFLYNHLTSQWDPIEAVDVPPNVYRVPNLPGDEEQYLEIPATKAHDPRILRTLARFRPPLAESNGNGVPLPTSLKSNGTRKRSMYDADAHAQASNGRKKLDCDQVRAKILSLIDSGVKVSDFTRALGVSNPSYYRFMGQSGPDKGSGSEVYSEALRYFASTFPHGEMDDEHTSLISSAKRPRRSISSSSSADSDDYPSRQRPSISHSFSSATSAAQVPSGPPNELFNPIPDITGISVENELSDSFVSPLNCDQIRVFINQYFESTKETQASFLRTLMAQYHTEDKKIQSVQLQRFRGMRGETAGATNPVFYAAGVYFEKLRRGKEREKERKERGEL
ncbi:uncharacterized protein PV09_09007 [Verruconis gallopava]|uniref:DUF7726 domain-containing protein n=1 Tax=Verruconis gallopava TaxID=253628 RepID=A0A0D1ZZ46_9PEZI|nr:uncharacterized protein PV09_09007 [Verruconis gallopava]KIV99349.1 hypothetical protein PV09_09007 [Verruconis gallopava]